jgi:hypothetical protein
MHSTLALLKDKFSGSTQNPLDQKQQDKAQGMPVFTMILLKLQFGNC